MASSWPTVKSSLVRKQSLRSATNLASWLPHRPLSKANPVSLTAEVAFNGNLLQSLQPEKCPDDPFMDSNRLHSIRATSPSSSPIPRRVNSRVRGRACTSSNTRYLEDLLPQVLPDSPITGAKRVYSLSESDTELALALEMAMVSLDTESQDLPPLQEDKVISVKKSWKCQN